MSYTYNSWVTQLLNTVAAVSSDPNWQTEIPGIIDYAEQRIYRELDLLVTRVTDQTATLTGNQRTFVLPTGIGTFIVVEEVNVISPSSADFNTGTRTPLVPVSKQFIDWAWPAAISGANAVPEWYAMLDGVNVLVGPPPDANYPIEIVGTQRPIPLSSANQTTFLTTIYPDLWFACSMVKASGFMRNFGSQADNPAMAVSWEAQYKTLFQSADAEEARRTFRSMAWTSEQQKPVTIPPRQ
jgi:hypothetical protein